jgi:hypothetical protein
MVERSPVPWTILRATQFHEFVLMQIRFLDRLPVLLAPRGFLLQPIDIGEVAGRLTELALAEPAGRARGYRRSGGRDVRGVREVVPRGVGAAEEDRGGRGPREDGACLSATGRR